MKRLIIYLLLLFVVFSKKLAYAHDFKVNDIYYLIIKENEVAVTYANYGESKSYSGNVNIPPSVTYNGKTYSVTMIGGYAFRNCNEVTSVTIPNSVTKINAEAFKGCSKLTSFTIPESIIEIGYDAFKSCYQLKTLNYNAVSCADYSTNGYGIPFDNLSISTINIGNSVERIPAYFAYGLDNLTSITIPNSVTTIGSHAFAYCTGLTDVIIPNSVVEIGLYAFIGCSSMEKVQINDLGTWCNISFYSSDSNPLSSAHHLYLNGMEITDLTIPNSVITIGNYAFYGYTGLTNLTIPSSVTTIGESAFRDCFGLTNVNLTNSVIKISSYSFAGCSGLTQFDIPNSITSIDDGVFKQCSLLTNVTIPSSVTSIGNSAFNGCTSLSNVVIPNSVISVGSNAYYDCSGLISITFGASLSSIGAKAFMNDPSIESVTCFATTPPSCNDLSMFTANVYNHAQLHVPVDSERSYKSDPYWGQFLTIIGDVNEDNPSDEDYMKCDTNGDGEVNIADVNRVIDAILSH